MAAPVLDLLLAAVDFSSTTLAILGVFSAFIVVLVAWFASQMVIAAVRGEVFYNGKRYSREVWEDALNDVKGQIRSGALVDRSSRDAVARYEGGRFSAGRPNSRSSESARFSRRSYESVGEYRHRVQAEKKVASGYYDRLRDEHGKNW